MERVKPPPRPPRQRRAFSTFGGPIDVGGDAEAGRALRDLFRVDPALPRALTHGFHSYAGRMHPSIARAALARWSRPGDVVLDPFCGSGTVVVEAMGLGRAALGIDASPLGTEIARVRSTVLGEAGRRRLVEVATGIAHESGDRARKRRRPEIPPWARRELTRFHPHVALELLGLRELVLGSATGGIDLDIGRALRLVFSSILVKLLKSGPEAPRDGEAKRIARGVPSRLLADRAEELAAGLAALESRTPSGTPAAAIRIGDARDLVGVADTSVALVVSSPPYAGTYDYQAQHDVRFTWLDLPRSNFHKTQIGARDKGLGTNPATWGEARARWLGQMARVLRPGGHVLLVAGDGVVGNRPEDAATAVADAAPRAGLVPIARASQQRALLDRRLQEIFGARQRREHLLLLRREP